MNSNIYDLIKSRRSYRKLAKSDTFDSNTMKELLRTARYVPSAFNMQSYRIIVLEGQSNEDLWNIVEEMLLEKIGKDKFISTKQKEKISGFRGGNGTLLFFEDENVVEENANKKKSYKAKFPSWSEQGSGIIQYAVWLMLTDKGLNASLQHYNPMIDDRVKKRFNIDDSWRLITQMPYGIGIDELKERKLLPFEDIVRFENK